MILLGFGLLGKEGSQQEQEQEEEQGRADQRSSG